MKINHAQILAMITSGDQRYFFTRIVYEDFSHKDVEVHLGDLINLGVAKTIRSEKKVAAWFDTDEGLKWLEEKYAEAENERSKQIF